MTSLSAWAYEKKQHWLTDLIDTFKGSGHCKVKWTFEIGDPHRKREQERYDKLVQSHRTKDV